jgi:hypothetical protein
MSQITRSASMISWNMSSLMLPGSTISPVVPPAGPAAVIAGAIKVLCICSKSISLPEASFPAERADDEGALHRVQAFPAGTQVSFSVAMTRCTRST